MAIEIEDPNNNLDLSGNGNPILEDVVILASADATDSDSVGVKATDTSPGSPQTE